MSVVFTYFKAARDTAGEAYFKFYFLNVYSDFAETRWLIKHYPLLEIIINKNNTGKTIRLKFYKVVISRRERTSPYWKIIVFLDQNNRFE